MSVKKSTGKKRITAIIASIMRSYAQTGEIDSSKPASRDAALQQATAIACAKAKKLNKG